MTVDPAIEAVFGPPPDNVDLAESSVAVNNGAVIAMLCLAAVAVLLRFAARVVLRNPLLADDWTIIVALFGIGGTTGISVAGGTVGAGKHLWAVSLKELMALYRLLFSYTFIYALSCTSTRVSILFFYKRVFSPLERYLKIAMLVSGTITLSYPIIVWVTMSTACRPLSYFWTQFSGTKGECIDINTFFLAAGIINMLNDIIILAIPFPRIAKLQMTLRKKLAVCSIMAVGIFVCVASIVRIHYLSVFMSALDITWLMGPVFIWSTIEPSVAIVCACLPHFAPLARIAHRSILSSYNSHSHSRPGLSSNKSRTFRRGSGVAQSHSHRGGGILQRMNKGTDDDEIGLTNYVTAGRHGASADTVSQIRVESTFVQASNKAP
ncbi:hypothetical protein BDW68DRAFT_163138 [Aspergillus falconensis]